MGAISRLLGENRDVRLLLGAGLVSMTGDWILNVGVAYYVYDVTGSTLASAGMLLAVFLPSILLSSVAGVFVDRWNRKTTMVGANLLLALGLLPLLLVHSADQIWIVYVVAAWEGIVELFFGPAERSFLPRLVADADLTTANALNGQIRDVSRLVGSAVGGVVVATGGITALALVDAATFLISALAIARIRASGRVESAAAADTPQVTASKLRAVAQEWSSGLRFSVSQRVLRVILIFSLVTTVGEGIMGTLFAPFVRDVLHGSGQDYGLIVSVQAVGGIVGGVVAASLGQRVSPVTMFGAGAIVFGLVDLVMFLYPLVFVEIWPAVVCMVVVGVPGAVTIVGLTTLLQRHTTDAYRGRVFGALGVVEGAAVVAGTLSAGFLGESVGIVPVLAMQGVGYVVAGAVVLATLARATSDEEPAQPAAATLPG
jgi:Na+/melibiose symporter-like transporter